MLCLGVSYPCIKSQLRAQEIDPRVLNYSDEGVDQMVELVQRSILTEMDGRDMVRCLAMEAGNDTMAYWCVFAYDCSFVSYATYFSLRCPFNVSLTRLLQLVPLNQNAQCISGEWC